MIDVIGKISYKNILNKIGRCFLSFLILLTLSVFLTKNTLAHFRGKPFIKIDGELTTIYTLSEGSYIGDEPIPSDAAPKKYLINQKIIFEADPTQLPFPKEVTDQGRYIWDFGDGTVAEGLKVEHTYSKQGSFEINVKIEYSDLNRFGVSVNDPSAIPPQNQLILIHITPETSYDLPKPVVFVDGANINTLVKNKLGILEQSAAIVEIYSHNKWFKTPRKVNFDASKTSGSAEVVKYIWLFDEYDDKPKVGAEVTNVFKDDYFLYDVTLRVIDKNGFYVDSFLKIANKDKDEKETNPTDFNMRIVNRDSIYIVVTILVGIILVYITKLSVKKSVGKN